jgi:2-amino-4-hydroxy-6-hydroxymethyldihydropteridine diphosphokinase
MPDPASRSPETTLHRAYLVLGSNQDPERHLPAAVPLLAEFGRIVAVSAAYQSPAFGVGEQPDYLNAAVVLETTLSAVAVCEAAVPFVEQRLGRVRVPGDKFAPRTIDVDLVLFDAAILRVAHRHVPDPDVLVRPFFALPLAEVAPDVSYPGDGRTLATIAASLDASAVERRDDVPMQRPPE